MSQGKKQNLIIIISAPSGSGKTTIVNRLLEQTSGLRCLVSYTTRPRRQGETGEKDYIFISNEEFKKKIETGDFLEWEEVFGNLYGSSEEQLKEALGAKEDIILSIDVKGARQVREKYPGSVSIFIMPPSKDELAARLKKRNTDMESEMSVRLKESGREMAAAEEYDYLIVNEDLDKAVKELQSIIETERKNREKK